MILNSNLNAHISDIIILFEKNNEKKTFQKLKIFENEKKNGKSFNIRRREI